MANNQTAKQRVEIEHQELITRYRALNTFINKGKPDGFDEQMWNTMVKQRIIMYEYM